jgi:mono/diheme cytochrome c family protein
LVRWPKTVSRSARTGRLVAWATAYACILWGLCLGVRPALADGPGSHSEQLRSDVSNSLRFQLRGDIRSTKTFDALANLVAMKKIRVFEPYEERPAEFYAFPFNAVLDEVYGEDWRTQEEVLLTCADGYQPTFPVRRLLEYDAWLAFDRVDASSFSILKLESGKRRRVDLSPYYLIWDNADDPALRGEGDYGWPYQLIGIDFIRAQDRFPNMTPAEGSSAQALAGFAAFRVHCTRCHAINGEGGSVGPELNVPRNPVEYREEAWLRQWIDDPSSLIAGARMPAFNKTVADRERVIDDIMVYLGAISVQKVQPKSESSGDF